jgi:hypothetical protein
VLASPASHARRLARRFGTLLTPGLRDLPVPWHIIRRIPPALDVLLLRVDVQVMVGPGKINMHVVGLGDKAVAESRERVQARSRLRPVAAAEEASPSTWPRPTCRRRAATTTCRSRWR